MKTRSVPRNPSRTGDLAEAAFLLKASSLGFGVARPWGNAERYDFILDNGRRLLRVQVKCTTTLRARGYDVQPIYSTYQRRKIIYTARDIDALVAHVVPLDLWYVLPVSALAGHPSLRFYCFLPHRNHGLAVLFQQPPRSLLKIPIHGALDRSKKRRRRLSFALGACGLPPMSA